MGQPGSYPGRGEFDSRPCHHGLFDDAATDPAVLAAAEDYERRVAEDRPYEGAEDIEALVAEYLRLWCNLT